MPVSTAIAPFLKVTASRLGVVPGEDVTSCCCADAAAREASRQFRSPPLDGLEPPNT